MNERLSLTFKYALACEVFFIFICALLVGVMYFINSIDIQTKGVLYCLLVFQIPVIVLVGKYWYRMKINDKYLN